MEGGADELVLEMERVLPATPPVVFAAFTDPDELARWWGPQGFTVRSLEVPARAGERYRIEMQPPEGDSFDLTGEFREVDPPARLAFTFAYEDPDPDDVENLVVLTFRDLGESTALAFTQGPFKTEARRALHRDGWTDSFDRLEELVSPPGNAEIVRAVFEPFNGVNIAAIDWSVDVIREILGRAYSADIELRTLPSGLGTGVAEFYEGMDGVVRYLREWLEPFSEYYVENTDYIEAGRCVLVPSRQWGIGTGSGARAEIELTTLYELRDGKIARMDQYDTLEEAREAARHRG